MARASEHAIRERIRSAPRSALADVAEELAVCVAGTVRALGGRLLEAPLSGRPCVYYIVRIDERRTLGERSAVLGRVAEGVPFALDDGGARAVVDPMHADVAATYDHASRSLAAFDADPQQRALLVDHDLLERNWFNTAELRYHEAVLAPGAAIAVLGTAIRERDPDGAGVPYRDTSTRLRFAGSTRHALVICDRPEAP